MSYRGVVGSCIATSFSARGLSCSGAGNRVNTRGDPVTSLIVTADKGIDVNPLFGVDPVVCLMVVVSVKTLGCAGKKLRQSS